MSQMYSLCPNFFWVGHFCCTGNALNERFHPRYLWSHCLNGRNMIYVPICSLLSTNLWTFMEWLGRLVTLPSNLIATNNSLACSPITGLSAHLALVTYSLATGFSISGTLSDQFKCKYIPIINHHLWSWLMWMTNDFMCRFKTAHKQL